MDQALRHECIPAGLPGDAMAIDIGGLDGWAYYIHDPYGHRFQFLIWPDGETWGVALLYPPLEQRGPGLGLAPDGRLQLREQPKTLLDAFKVSVAWTTSLAVAERAGLVCD